MIESGGLGQKVGRAGLYEAGPKDDLDYPGYCRLPAK